MGYGFLILSVLAMIGNGLNIFIYIDRFKKYTAIKTLIIKLVSGKSCFINYKKLNIL